MVDRREGPVRPADFAAGQPQPVERLRRGDLVDQVQVDVEERLARFFVRTRWASQIFSNSVFGLYYNPFLSTRSPSSTLRLALTARMYAIALASNTSVETPRPV